MKRSPLRRKTPLRSRRHEPTVTREEHAQARAERIANQRPPKTLHRGVHGPAAMTARPKDELIQHEGYMRLVRTLACEHCGRPGPSEFAHADHGKGQSIKSDCRMGTSLCKWRSPEDPGCHWLIGTKRIYPKDERRELEKQMAARTRAKVDGMGLWPRNLPKWET